MPIRSAVPSYQEVLEATGTLAVGAHTYGPFSMGDFSGVLLDVTRSDDGTNGTLAVVIKVDDHASGDQLDLLDGAGAAVAMNNLAAGENVRRILQVHPTAGPAPSDDADGVFAYGTTGIAGTFYRQPMPADFYIVMTAATDASVINASLHFLN
jgi:hypothetical protein